MRTIWVLALACGVCVRAYGQGDAAAPGAGEPTAEDKAMAARAEAVAKTAVGTPGQEAMNFLVYDWPHSMVLMLKGETKVGAEQLENARKTVRDLLETAEKGPGWPRPPKVVIPRASKGPIVVDGKLDEPAWKKAAVFKGMYEYDAKDKIDAPATTWRMLWDKDNLYFAFECQDEDIEAPAIPRDGPVYDADCVEMFILPDFRLGQYWEIILSPAGSVFDSLQTKRMAGWGFLGRPDESVNGMQIAYTVDGTSNKPDDKDKGYVIEVAVPFKELPSYTRGNAPKPGDTLNLMLARFDKTGDKIRHFAFQPLLSWGHNIWNHAPVELGR